MQGGIVDDRNWKIQHKRGIISPRGNPRREILSQWRRFFPHWLLYSRFIQRYSRILRVFSRKQFCVVRIPPLLSEQKQFCSRCRQSGRSTGAKLRPLQADKTLGAILRPAEKGDWLLARAVIYLLQGQKVGDKMSPQMGRPPKENPRNVNLNLRITKDEAILIQECADKLQKTRTDVIIEGVKLVKASIDKK